VIFADSSLFVALADKKDQWHNDAVRLGPSVTKGTVVSDLVVAESVTIIGSRGGGRAAATLYEFFRDSCDIEFVDRRRLEAAMRHHLMFDGRLSVADCASVVIMTERKLRRIVSFDKDFDRVKGIERAS
jgi:predicted nucleic acid-binding protein